jgi:hypothetical protein
MGKRRRARFKTDLTVQITCLDLPGYTSKARLADLSAHGLGLILNEKLQVGATVKVEWGNLAFIGKSIYCNPHGQEFLIGLRVKDPVYETAKKCISQSPRRNA